MQVVGVHRKETFEATAEIMDRLKKRVRSGFGARPCALPEAIYLSSSMQLAFSCEAPPLLPLVGEARVFFGTGSDLEAGGMGRWGYMAGRRRC